MSTIKLTVIHYVQQTQNGYTDFYAFGHIAGSWGRASEAARNAYNALKDQGIAASINEETILIPFPKDW